MSCINYVIQSLGDLGNNDAWTEVARLCSNNDTYKVFDGKRLVKVVFSTDSSVHKTGFSGKAETGKISPHEIFYPCFNLACCLHFTIEPLFKSKLNLRVL